MQDASIITLAHIVSHTIIWLSLIFAVVQIVKYISLFYIEKIKQATIEQQNQHLLISKILNNFNANNSNASKAINKNYLEQLVERFNKLIDSLSKSMS